MSSFNFFYFFINLGRYEFIKCDFLELLLLYIKLYIVENVVIFRLSIQFLLLFVYCILCFFGYYFIVGCFCGNDIYYSQQIICMVDLYGFYIFDLNDGYIDVSCSYLGLLLLFVYEVDLMMQNVCYVGEGIECFNSYEDFS